MPLQLGLCSVTFRKLSWERVLEIAREAGVGGIEWGADVHVPAGDLDRAKAVAAASAESGVAVASYGSYIEAGNATMEEFESVLRTAVALGAPNIRIWAGMRGVGSADAVSRLRQQCIADLRTFGQKAARNKIALSLEYHRDTLTDTLDSTLSLLEAVGEENLLSYWQPAYYDPPRGTDPNIALDELRALRPKLSHLHVFNWNIDRERVPLSDAREFWQPILHEVSSWDDRARYAFVEFVRADDPEIFQSEATTLSSWL